MAQPTCCVKNWFAPWACNKEVRTFPKVVLSWCDGSKTEIYFATNDEANNYVDILVAKCKEGGNVLLALSKD